MKRSGMCFPCSLSATYLTIHSRELAELLGQVKPPVATREDIDNSGLQIIKSSELEEYEREGKVASNCVERVRSCPLPSACEGSLTDMAASVLSA